jgi:site-specific DNA recombinase
MNSSQPLTPKNPNGVLQVILIGRISTPGQDIDAIASRHDGLECWLRQSYTGATQIQRYGEQASGMLAVRQTITDALERVHSGECDLVLVTELRDVFRNPRFLWAFVQVCVDNDVRFISLADQIDTADENWEVMMHTAALRHGLAVPDARRRVRSKAAFSFANGGWVQKVKYGYRKLTKDEANRGEFGPKGLRIVKRPECTTVILAMRDRILSGCGATRLADWLNAEGIDPGPYVKSRRWTRALVTGLLRDPILSGTRSFRKIVYRQIYETGKYRREANKNGPETQHVPELAHLTVDEQAQMIAALDARRKGNGPAAGKDSPLYRQPRNRSIWPGQHAICGACGGLMYRSGEFLRCQNTMSSGPRSCWNHVQTEYSCIRENVAFWLLGIIDRQPGLRTIVAAVAWKECERLQQRRHHSGSDRSQRLAVLTGQATALAKAIKKGGKLDALLAELGAVETEIKKLRREQMQAEDKVERTGEFASEADVAGRLDEILPLMMETSHEFADFLRRLIPEFVIQPIQALDRPLVRSRAKLRLSLAPWTQGPEPPFETTVELDVFEPPLHIKYLDACVAAKHANPDATLTMIADQLGVTLMTVNRVFAYHRLMQKQGVTDPYRVLTERPEHASRWDRAPRNPPEDRPE